MKRFCIFLLIIILILGFNFSVLAKEKVTLYTSVPQSIIDNIKKDFEQKNPDIDLEIYRSGTSNVLAKLYAEKESNNIVVDVIWVADFSIYENLKAENILYPYLSPEAVNVPQVYYEPEGYYYGARLINMVLGYNTKFIKGDDIPDSWKDVLDPRFKGKVGNSTPERSGAFFVTAGAFANNPELGWDYFVELAKQNPVLDSNTGAANKIASGELLMGFVLDYSIRTMKDKGSPIDFVWPIEGAVSVPSPIGIIASTKNLENAKRFVDYSISQDGQKEFARNGFIPIRKDVAPPAGTPDLDDIKLMEIDWEWMRENYSEIIQKFNSILIE
ncbi:MAG: ABC transporter substrate-binding protein [Atribacterota bacterium]